MKYLKSILRLFWSNNCICQWHVVICDFSNKHKYVWFITSKPIVFVLIIFYTMNTRSSGMCSFHYIPSVLFHQHCVRKHVWLLLETEMGAWNVLRYASVCLLSPSTATCFLNYFKLAADCILWQTVNSSKLVHPEIRIPRHHQWFTKVFDVVQYNFTCSLSLSMTDEYVFLIRPQAMWVLHTSFCLNSVGTCWNIYYFTTMAYLS